MTVLKYNPFNDVDDMPGMKHLQDTVARFFNDASRPWTPAVDIRETENELVLEMDVPGVAQEDVEIRLENYALTIKGERKFDSENQGKGYHRIERSYGSFARTFTLPNSVDTEKVKADYKNGVLSVTLPKKEVAKPRTIRVEIGNQ
jgi:HSP20 family protein